MSQTDDDQGWEMVKIVSEHYRQDLRELWSRLGLFGIAQAFLFTAFATLVVQSRVVAGREVSPHCTAWFEITLGAIGALLGLVAFIVTLATKKWIIRWRRQMIEIEREVVDKKYQCYIKVEDISAEPQWKRMLLRGASVGTECIPLIFFVGWIAMILVVILAGRQVTP